jgi:hypothetical protein
MATTTTCDHCHQPIGDYDRVDVIITDWARVTALREMVEPRILSANLNLHRSCYEERLLSTIDRIGQ